MYDGYDTGQTFITAIQPSFALYKSCIRRGGKRQVPTKSIHVTVGGIEPNTNKDDYYEYAKVSGVELALVDGEYLDNQRVGQVFDDPDIAALWKTIYGLVTLLDAPEVTDKYRPYFGVSAPYEPNTFMVGKAMKSEYLWCDVRFIHQVLDVIQREIEQVKWPGSVKLCPIGLAYVHPNGGINKPKHGMKYGGADWEISFDPIKVPKTSKHIKQTAVYHWLCTYALARFLAQDANSENLEMPFGMGLDDIHALSTHLIGVYGGYNKEVNVQEEIQNCQDIREKLMAFMLGGHSDSFPEFNYRCNNPEMVELRRLHIIFNLCLGFAAERTGVYTTDYKGSFVKGDHKPMKANMPDYTRPVLEGPMPPVNLIPAVNDNRKGMFILALWQKNGPMKYDWVMPEERDPINSVSFDRGELVGSLGEKNKIQEIYRKVSRDGRVYVEEIKEKPYYTWRFPAEWEGTITPEYLYMLVLSYITDCGDAHYRCLESSGMKKLYSVGRFVKVLNVKDHTKIEIKDPDDPSVKIIGVTVPSTVVANTKVDTHKHFEGIDERTREEKAQGPESVEGIKPNPPKSPDPPEEPEPDKEDPDSDESGEPKE